MDIYPDSAPRHGNSRGRSSWTFYGQFLSQIPHAGYLPSRTIPRSFLFRSILSPEHRTFFLSDNSRRTFSGHFPLKFLGTFSRIIPPDIHQTISPADICPRAFPLTVPPDICPITDVLPNNLPQTFPLSRTNFPEYFPLSNFIAASWALQSMGWLLLAAIVMNSA